MKKSYSIFNYGSEVHLSTFAGFPFLSVHVSALNDVSLISRYKSQTAELLRSHLLRKIHNEGEAHVSTMPAYLFRDGTYHSSLFFTVTAKSIVEMSHSQLLLKGVLS